MMGLVISPFGHIDCRAGSNGRAEKPSLQPVNITLPSTAEDVKNVMGKAMVDVRAKKLDPRIAMALTSMSRVLLEAFQTADLQKRVERLEQARATAERSQEPLPPAADSESE